MWVGGRGGSALLSDLVAQTTEGRATQREGLMARVRQEGHLPKGMKYTKALVWKETPFLGLLLAFQLLEKRFKIASLDHLIRKTWFAVYINNIHSKTMEAAPILGGPPSGQDRY